MRACGGVDEFERTMRAEGWKLPPSSTSVFPLPVHPLSMGMHEEGKNEKVEKGEEGRKRGKGKEDEW